jgi:stress-induced morphogen
MSPDEIKNRIETLAPRTKVTIKDLTGTQDHYEATVVSSVFEGRPTIEQHRMVLEILKTEVESGDVHALSLKTYTPEQYSNK